MSYLPLIHSPHDIGVVGCEPCKRDQNLKPRYVPIRVMAHECRSFSEHLLEPRCWVSCLLSSPFHFLKLANCISFFPLCRCGCSDLLCMPMNVTICCRYDAITAAADTAVTVSYQTDEDGVGTEDCYTNPYGIMPLEQHGGSYPGKYMHTRTELWLRSCFHTVVTQSTCQGKSGFTCQMHIFRLRYIFVVDLGAFYNTAGNTVTGDYCMAINVLLTNGCVKCAQH